MFRARNLGLRLSSKRSLLLPLDSALWVLAVSKGSLSQQASVLWSSVVQFIAT